MPYLEDFMFTVLRKPGRAFVSRLLLIL